MEEKLLLTEDSNQLWDRSKVRALEYGYSAQSSFFFLLAYLDHHDGILRDFLNENHFPSDQLMQWVQRKPSIAEDQWSDTLVPQVLAMWMEAKKEAAYHGSERIAPHHVIAAALEIDGSECRRIFASFHKGYSHFQKFLLQRNIITKERQLWNAENEVETLFLEAHNEPALRPEFHRLLLNSEVIFLNVKSDAPKFTPYGFLTLTDMKTVPLFTSLKRVTDNGGMPGNFECYTIPFSQFLRRFVNVEFPALWINPTSVLNQQVFSEEVEKWSKGIFHSYESKEIPLDEMYPPGFRLRAINGKIKKSLSEWALRHSEVRELYAAIVSDRANREVTFVVAYDVTRNGGPIVNELLSLLWAYAKTSDIILSVKEVSTQPEYITTSDFLVYSAGGLIRFKDSVIGFFTARDE